jgi:hypothetical protein
MGKGSVIPSVMPEQSIFLKSMKVLIDILRDGVSIGESHGIVAAGFSTLDAVELKVFEMPGNNKRDCLSAPRCKSYGIFQGPD